MKVKTKAEQVIDAYNAEKTVGKMVGEHAGRRAVS
jgi:hypothetical protein